MFWARPLECPGNKHFRELFAEALCFRETSFVGCCGILRTSAQEARKRSKTTNRPILASCRKSLERSANKSAPQWRPGHRFLFKPALLFQPKERLNSKSGSGDPQGVTVLLWSAVDTTPYHLCLIVVWFCSSFVRLYHWLSFLFGRGACQRKVFFLFSGGGLPKEGVLLKPRVGDATPWGFPEKVGALRRAECRRLLQPHLLHRPPLP